ncbi:probable glycosyltransferase At5g03795 [Andrographis paniculata]|uniref:probable glycosyltransferase At5g03795 n=1 Tax=Andrographis paniculata TaxID=175694 RepID=UPI0021E87C51|nr:probable glycosyltransferase At5g03795 [Andrographis paniculata]
MHFSSSASSWMKHLCTLIPLAMVILLSGFYVNPDYLHQYLSSMNNRTILEEHDGRLSLGFESRDDVRRHSGKFVNSSHRRFNSRAKLVESEDGMSDLEKVEADLAEARAAILGGGNVTDGSDYVPKGAIYLNPKVFQRSYLEMEKRLRIYVYEEGEPPLFHLGPCKHTYSIEGIFMSGMEVGRFRTYDPRRAHLFFLPISITMLAEAIYQRGSHDWAPMKSAALDYISVIARKYPFWNRTRAADHFMLACHDWGPEISLAVPNLHNNSIRALCNANTSERFDPCRDVSVPEIHIPGDSLKGLIGGPPPSQRPILVFYAGGVHGPIRPILLEHWENKSDPEVQIFRYLPKKVSYYGMMRKSKYCLCPSGYEVASPRMVEGLYLGCVPVLIKDGYVPPLSDVLNWETFAVTLPVEDIPNLKGILAGISLRRYVRMQRAGIQVRRHFMINSPAQRYDVFHMILHSIWLRRLNVRLRENQSLFTDIDD